jgi:hypothetical protein
MNGPDKPNALALLIPKGKDDLLAYVKNESNPPNLRHKALKSLLKLDPSLADELGGDFVAKATQVALSSMSNRDEWAVEVGMAKLTHEKQKLVGTDPDPVVSSYADRIVTCWLRVQEAELQLGHNQASSLRVREHLQNKVTQAQTNYLQAMRALTAYRNERDRLRMLATGRR